MSIIAEPLLTWLDVERLLKQRTGLWSQLPTGVQGIDCFADGMEIRHAAPVAVVDSWLKETFGAAYRVEGNMRAIRLRIADTLYPVDLIHATEQATTAGATYPLWRDVTYLPDSSFQQRETAGFPPLWEEGPLLVSFHSFKGGVGQTTALMTYVAACMDERSASNKKILVVDADLEAPGISFWLDEGNRPQVSFVQLLEAMHYPPSGIDPSLDFFADELRKASLSLSGLQHELFVLPAALHLGEIQDMPVTPEHLASNPTNPWELADHLHALGKRLGADAVFIDLRSGLSELASPILFDPRVEHFFVTTVAPQSVQGMTEVLHRLHRFNQRLPAERREEARPTLILSLLTKELRDAACYERALSQLNAAYPPEEILTSGIQWQESDFLNPLMSIGSVSEALDTVVLSSRLFSSAAEWATALYAPPTA